MDKHSLYDIVERAYIDVWNERIGILRIDKVECVNRFIKIVPFAITKDKGKQTIITFHCKNCPEKKTCYEGAYALRLCANRKISCRFHLSF